MPADKSAKKNSPSSYDKLSFLEDDFSLDDLQYQSNDKLKKLVDSTKQNAIIKTTKRLNSANTNVSEKKQRQPLDVDVFLKPEPVEDKQPISNVPVMLERINSALSDSSASIAKKRARSDNEPFLNRPEKKSTENKAAEKPYEYAASENYAERLSPANAPSNESAEAQRKDNDQAYTKSFDAQNLIPTAKRQTADETIKKLTEMKNINIKQPKVYVPGATQVRRPDTITPSPAVFRQTNATVIPVADKKAISNVPVIHTAEKHLSTPAQETQRDIKPSAPYSEGAEDKHPAKTDKIKKETNSKETNKKEKKQVKGKPKSKNKKKAKANGEPQKKGRRGLKRTILNILSLIILALLVWQGVKIITYYYQLHRNNKNIEVFNEIVSQFINEEANSDTIDWQPDEEVDGDFLSYAGTSENPGLINRLREEFSNNDIVAYIYVQGTEISYPIVQTDNNDYYLKRSVSKEISATGAIFADSECNFDKFTTKNNVLYGHNTSNGTMFHNLKFFLKSDFFWKNRYIIVKFEDRTTIWEIFSAYQTTTQFNYNQVLFSGDEEFSDLIKKMRSKSYIRTDMPVTSDDMILTLSTCTSVQRNGRVVVHAKLAHETILR